MPRWRDFALTILLCAVAGSADAVAYIRFGTFVGAMTGNTVLLGIDLANWHGAKALYHVGIIAAFVAAVIAGRAATLWWLPPGTVLVGTAIMLAAAGSIESAWGAAIGAAALGLQNVAVRKIGGVSVNTAFITGDLVRLGAAAPQAGASEQRNQVAMLAVAWLSYAAGAVLGALALMVTTFAMAVPVVLALAAAALVAAGPRLQ